MQKGIILTEKGIIIKYMVFYGKENRGVTACFKNAVNFLVS
jgi:hypothetical protein